MSEMNQEHIDRAATTLGTMLDYLGLKASVKGEEKNGKCILTVFSDESGRIIGRKGMTLSSIQLLLNRMLQKIDPEFGNVVVDVDGYRRNNNRGGSDRRDDGGRRSSSGGRDGRDGRGGRDGRDDRQSDRRGSNNDNRNQRRDRDDEDSRNDNPRQEYDDKQEYRDDIDEARLTRQAEDAAKEVKRWGDPVSLPPMNSRERRVIHVALQDDEEVITESVDSSRGSLKNVVVKLKKHN